MWWWYREWLGRRKRGLELLGAYFPEAGGGLAFNSLSSIAVNKVVNDLAIALVSFV